MSVVSTLLDVFAVGALLALLLGAGRALSGPRPDRDPVLDVAIGAVALHLLLSILDLLSLPWWPPFVLGLLLLGLGLSVLRVPPTRWPKSRPAPADLISLFGVGLFAALTLRSWAAHDDFVFHWGLKGHRYYLSSGIDYAWFAREELWFLHPDYPNLLPELFAFTAVLRRGFTDPAMLLWSAVFLAAITLGMRRILRGLPSLTAIATGVLTWALLVPSVGMGMAGNADWLPAIALLLAAPAILADKPGGDDDLRIAGAAALAASSKVEGILLAGLLLLAHLLRHRSWRRGLATAWPTMLAVSLWAIAVHRHGLLAETRTHGIDLGRLPEVLRALPEGALAPGWHGLGALTVLLLPLLLLFARGSRRLSTICAVQLCLYVVIYLSSEIDPRMWVVTSFPRLIFHLAPTVLALTVLELAKQGASEADKATRPRRASASA